MFNSQWKCDRIIGTSAYTWHNDHTNTQKMSDFNNEFHFLILPNNRHWHTKFKLNIFLINNEHKLYQATNFHTKYVFWTKM